MNYNPRDGMTWINSHRYRRYAKAAKWLTKVLGRKTFMRLLEVYNKLNPPNKGHRAPIV